MVYPDTPVSSINKTDHNDITAILLKVAVNTIALTNILYIKTISALSRVQLTMSEILTHNVNGDMH
jgi:hypothetical protein